MAEAKTEMLGVSGDLIQKEGAVSRAVALAMAEGALKNSGASWAFSITGLAGPGKADGLVRDSFDVPIGTVWVGIARKRSGRVRSEAKMFSFTGSRKEVRETAAMAALEEVYERILTEVGF
jgi:nicotinamide-nucleotide amidase